MARSPLKLLTPRNHGKGSWVFAANFGGGLVDGDALSLQVDVGDDAVALLGTQAQTKVYRSSKGSSQSLQATVGNDALLVSIPDLVACFEDSRYTQRSCVQLAGSSSLVWLDGLSCGRAARQERWLFSRYQTRTVIEREGKALVIDAVTLDERHGSLAQRMGRFEACATLIVVGPRLTELRHNLLAAGSHPLERRLAQDRLAPSRIELLSSASPIGDDAAVVRFAGTSVEVVTDAIREQLTLLGTVLGDDPFARKW